MTQTWSVTFRERKVESGGREREGKTVRGKWEGGGREEGGLKGGMFFAQALHINTTLHHLGPGRNRLGQSCRERKRRRELVEREREREQKGAGVEVKGGMFFAQALQINTTLHHLDLGDTDLVSHTERERFVGGSGGGRERGRRGRGKRREACSLHRLY